MANMQKNFDAYAQQNKQLALDQVNKWLTDAQISGKKVAEKEIKECFEKFKSHTMDYATFEKFLDELAKKTNIKVSELKEMLANLQKAEPEKGCKK